MCYSLFGLYHFQGGGEFRRLQYHKDSTLDTESSLVKDVSTFPSCQQVMLSVHLKATQEHQKHTRPHSHPEVLSSRMRFAIMCYEMPTPGPRLCLSGSKPH